MGGDTFHAHIQHQPDGSPHPQDPAEIVAPGVEALGRLYELKLVVAEVQGVLHAQPPADHRPQVPQQRAITVEDPAAFRPAEPLMPVGRQEVDVHGPHVDGEYAQALDGVHTEEDAPFLADPPQGRQVGAIAAGELHGRDGYHPGLAGDGIGDAFNRYPPVFLRNHLELHAARLQAHPGVHVGRKLDVGGDHIVPAAPSQAVGHPAQSLRGIFHKGDFLGRGVDQLGGPAADLLCLLVEIRPHRGVVASFPGVAFHGLRRRAAERSHPRVVQEVIVAGDRKQLPRLADLHTVLPDVGRSAGRPPRGRDHITFQLYPFPALGSTAVPDGKPRFLTGAVTPSEQPCSAPRYADLSPPEASAASRKTTD